MNLKDFSTEELARELLGRDVREAGGGFIAPVFKLIEKSVPLLCTDGIALRKNGSAYEAMAILRGTGRYAGCYCSVGGRVFYRESLEGAMRRHFRTDVGAEIRMLRPWNRPLTMAQWVPVAVGEEPPPDFGPEERKHSVSLYFPVMLKGEVGNFGQGHGGQEVKSVEWFTLDKLPPRYRWGFDQRQFFVTALEEAATTGLII